MKKLLTVDTPEFSVNKELSEISLKLSNAQSSLMMSNENQQLSCIPQVGQKFSFGEKKKDKMQSKVKRKGKMNLKKFLVSHGLFNKNDKKWSAPDTIKLFKGYQRYKGNWKRISEILKDKRSVISISCYFFNVLKWAADEYKYDHDRSLKRFENCQFKTPHKQMYIKSVFSASQSQLLYLIEVAHFLLGIANPNNGLSDTKPYSEISVKSEERSCETNLKIQRKRNRIEEYFQPQSESKNS